MKPFYISGLYLLYLSFVPSLTLHISSAVDHNITQNQSQNNSQSQNQPLSNNQNLNQQRVQNLTGLAILGNVNFIEDSDNNITSGVLFDIFEEVWTNSNITATYKAWTLSTKTSDFTTVLELVSNGTYDFALGYPIISHGDNENDDDSAFKGYGLTKIDVLTDTAIVYTPNILQLLVGNVLQEMFFAVGIVILPWFLVNTLLFYLIEIRKFSKVDFFKGFFEAFLTITFRHQIMSTTAKVYSTVFYFITAIICMLLLGDFIYVIASMILSLDMSNSGQAVDSHSTTCMVEDDLLTSSFMEARQDIPRLISLDVNGCLSQLNSLNIGSFMASKAYMMNYLYRNPHQNNRFTFYLRDSIVLTYSILVCSKIGISDEISQILSSFRPSFYQRIHKNYYVQPVYNKIAPSSIFSNSILLIFMSLTITSLFIILFLIVLIYRMFRRKASTNSKMSSNGDKGDSLSKYKLLRQHSKIAKKRISEMDDTENTEDNYQSPSLPNQSLHQPRQRQLLMQRRALKHGNPFAKDHSLSLSGPIQIDKLKGKPESSWPEIESQDYNKKEGIENQEPLENHLSLVHRIGEIDKRNQQSAVNTETQDQVEGKVLSLFKRRFNRSR